MPSYMSIDASKHNGTARKTTLAEFGIKPKQPEITWKTVSTAMTKAHIRQMELQRKRKRQAKIEKRKEMEAALTARRAAAKEEREMNLISRKQYEAQQKARRKAS